MRRIDNLVILGRAFPQQLKDGRISCCTAGWSPTLGLIRIYPTDYKSEKLKRWNIVSIKVEHNPNDWRHESWKILDSKDWRNVDDKIEVKGTYPKDKRLELIEKTIPKHCPNTLNDIRTSLGLVEPKILDYEFKENKKGEEILRIHYNCLPRCFSASFHNQQVLEYGVYEWIRKNPDYRDKVVDNLHLMEDDWKKYFLIGNSYRAPRSFMIIEILRFKR